MKTKKKTVQKTPETVWKKSVPSIEALNTFAIRDMLKTLGISFTEVGPNHITATMPVNENTKQPIGILHGGANTALAESVASVAATLAIEGDKTAVGLEINANHIRPTKSGKVTATATPYHIGKKTQIWEIKIKNDDGKLVCISRMTMAILENENL